MTKNNLLSEKLNYIGASDTPTHLHLCSYNAEEVQSFQENNLEKIIPSLKEDHINWIQVHGLQNTEMVHQICRHFCIDFLTIQDILNSKHLTKIEEHDTYNVVILKQLLTADSKEFVPQQLCIVQGKDFVLTFTESETDFLTKFIQHWKRMY